MRQVTSAVLTVFFAVNLAMAQDAGMGTGAQRCSSALFAPTRFNN